MFKQQISITKTSHIHEYTRCDKHPYEDCDNHHHNDTKEDSEDVYT